MVYIGQFPPSEEERAVQLLASELGATPVDPSEAAGLVIAPRKLDPRLEGLDPYDEALAEADGAKLAAGGLTKVTTNGSRLSLLKGKLEPKRYDGPMEVDL
jgi:hypothetical protein